MFERLPDLGGESIEFLLDGQPCTARAGDSVAAALLAADRPVFRVTPVRGAPRGPWCLMGSCFDCLVTIDGRDNQQACMTVVVSGMRVETRQGARSIVQQQDADA